VEFKALASHFSPAYKKAMGEALSEENLADTLKEKGIETGADALFGIFPGLSKVGLGSRVAQATAGVGEALSHVAKPVLNAADTTLGRAGIQMVTPGLRELSAAAQLAQTPGYLVRGPRYLAQKGAQVRR